jgi:transglutaminase-like putative cysteine protease
MHRTRKITSAVLSVLTLAGSAYFLFTPSHVRADNAPDWLRAVSQNKLPEYPRDTDAVVLLDQRETVVKNNGDIETRYRRAYKLFRTEAAKEYGGVLVNFDQETQISFLKAWTIMPDGRQIEIKEKDAVEGTAAGALFTDQRYKYIKFPEANPGSIVAYEYVQKHRPFVFEDNWSFQQRVPCMRARFSLQIPAGWEFTSHWANYAEQEPHTVADNQYLWEVQDVPAIDIEPEMPSLYAVAGRMDVKYFARDPKLRARTSGTWNDLGIWYAALTSASRASTPAIQKKVAELTAGLKDPVAKIKVLTSYAQRQIHYVAIEIGIGGFQPHPAAEVFAHQYGDCKDKATLLSTMLHEIGISSYYVLIETRRGIVNPDFPSTRFNHVILAIQLPDDVQDPSLYAVVNQPKLGRLLFFDPTNPDVPLGYLPSYLQDNFGLLITSDSGTLVSLPLLPPATNRLLRTAKLTLSPTGNLAGEVQELRWGGPAVDIREHYLQVSPSERQKVIESFLGTFLGNFTLTAASLGNLDHSDQTLTLDYKFVALGYAKPAGDLLIVRPRVVGGKGSTLLAGKTRKYPVEFHETTRQDDIFDITLPPGYVADELPPPVHAECAYATYKSEVQVTENVLHYKRSYEITDLIVPTDKLPEVRDFFHQIAADEKSSAILRRVTP